jgi:hypothetical protein
MRLALMQLLYQLIKSKWLPHEHSALASERIANRAIVARGPATNVFKKMILGAHA